MLDELKAADPRRFLLMLDARDLGAFTIDKNTCTSSFDQMPGPSRSTRCAEVSRTELRAQVRPLRLGVASRRPTPNREIHVGAAAWLRQSDAPLVHDGHPRPAGGPAAMVER